MYFRRGRKKTEKGIEEKEKHARKITKKGIRRGNKKIKDMGNGRNKNERNESENDNRRKKV